MYDEMTISDLLVTAHQRAHPEDQPSAEHALLIDELSRRLRRLDIWRSKVSAEINPYLTDQDGSNLMSEPHRIRYMLQRLSSTHPMPVPVSQRLPDQSDTDEHGCCWWFYPESYSQPSLWSYSRGNELATHRLPYHALPLPSVEVRP